MVVAVEGPNRCHDRTRGATLRVAVAATTKISRKDFGLTWNAALESGGLLVGDDVTITLEVEFVKAA